MLLPDYPMDHLRDALTDLGFTRFVPTRSGVEVELDDLRFMIVSLTAPTDGPIGDSCLAVDDGTATFLNQNDARPPDLEPLIRFGPYDGHALQFSGAIWYPMVYDLPVKAKHALGKQKRSNGMERARRYVDAVGARHVFPNSGPPAFLDDELFALNDLADPEDNGNPFPGNQTVFIDYLRERDITGVELLVPGSTADLSRTECTVTHRSDPAEPFRSTMHGYLERYQQRVRPLLDAERASWARGTEPLQPQLAEWWDPVLAAAPRLCAGVGDRVLLVTEQERIVVDFAAQRVIPDDGSPCRYPIRDSRRADPNPSAGPARRTGSTGCSCPAASARSGPARTTTTSTCSSRACRPTGSATSRNGWHCPRRTRVCGGSVDFGWCSVAARTWAPIWRASGTSRTAC